MATTTTTTSLLLGQPPSTALDKQHLVMRKYLVLHQQHESLRQQLDDLRPRSPHLLAAASTSSFPALCAATAFTAATETGWAYASSSALPAADVAQAEARLCDINEGIKRCLTELLNCDAVRANPNFRTWVQRRLMDTEQEMRKRRRRRSAPDA